MKIHCLGIFTLFLLSFFLGSCSNSTLENEWDDCKIKNNEILFDDSTFPYVGLPRIFIATGYAQGVHHKEYVDAKMQIFGSDSALTEIYDIQIRGRGNSTWAKYPKKPYALKFSQKIPLLGMPKSRKWVLLANYRERTLMRNALALKVASETDLEWTPKGTFVELFMDGDFLGNYYLCEKIDVQKEKLNISKDGYLLEFDSYYDEEYKFRSSLKNLPINIKNPDSPSVESIAYIRDYIDTVESILYGEEKGLDIKNYIDYGSFADYFIVNNVAQSSELTYPKSVYMYKDVKGLLKAGPVWDYDYNTFTPSKSGLLNQKSLWYDKLMQDELFVSMVKEKWNRYKDDFAENISFIDSVADYIYESNERNNQLWPIRIEAGFIGDENYRFDTAVLMLKNIYSRRLAELNSLINGL